MTFKELYAKSKSQPLPERPSAAFVREVCEVTKRSEVAVRRWLCDGESACQPDALTQDVLARHFGTTPDQLFPKD